ncbi:hypothetical protein [Agromyces sp. C10]|uniref:hypothetical protein n=1 Tax=Agromyces sp. C10 TaxID=2935077 RepID=UPI00200AF13A|nr:hypothetical protein [Agromyces sp. C10]MCK8609964.1 hypothetical protein [Agromyces sp. C10]
MGTGDASGRDDDRPAAGDPADAASPRQRVVRARGARRARLTPAPGSDPAPETATPGAHDEAERGTARRAAPEDERITRERPPHW